MARPCELPQHDSAAVPAGTPFVARRGISCVRRARRTLQRRSDLRVGRASIELAPSRDLLVDRRKGGYVSDPPEPSKTALIGDVTIIDAVEKHQGHRTREP